MDYNAFERCDKISEVVVPKNVEYVGSQTVIHDSLPPIYYNGTAEDWDAVESEFKYHEYYYEDNTINIYFYSEEQPTTEGNYWHYVDGAPVAW